MPRSKHTLECQGQGIGAEVTTVNDQEVMLTILVRETGTEIELIVDSLNDLDYIADAIYHAKMDQIALAEGE